MGNGKNVRKSLVMITQFSLNMIVPIAMCSFVGYLIDKAISTNFCVIILFFVGAIAGFRNIYIMSKEIYDDDSQKRRKH